MASPANDTEEEFSQYNEIETDFFKCCFKSLKEQFDKQLFCDIELVADYDQTT